VRGTLTHFASELSRRRVVRVLIGYCVAVFGALQGLDVMVSRLELPGVWMRWAVIASLAGLPLAAALSWIFDWTPEGVVRTAPAHATPAQPLSKGQHFVTWAVLAALAAGIVWVTWRDRRYRAARAQLDEAIRLADAGKLTESLALAVEAEKVIPQAPAFEKLWPEVSRLVDITTTPPGAQVRVRLNGADDSAWRALGTTPIAAARVPILPTQVRFTKDGYVPADRAMWRYGPYQVKLDAGLYREGEVPEGMVAIPGGDMAWVPLVGLENVAPGDVPEAFVDRTEVTNADYRRFVEAGGYAKRGYWKEPFVEGGRTLAWEEAMKRFRDRTGRPGPSTWQSGDFPEGQEQFPVAGVSWYEAAAYAAWAGKSLPTIYHWARAATTWASPDMLPHSNFGTGGPVRVGQSSGVSGYGLSDMAGNVKEWCWNSSGDRRFILGGGFNEPIYMFNDEDAQPPMEREANFGFRLARYPKPVRMELLADLPLERRDHTKEKPVDDAAFRIYAGLYGYDKAPLDARTESTADAGRWKVERVSYTAAYRGERVPALLFTPKNAPPPWQVVVFFPGSGSLHARSSEDLGPGSMGFLPKSGRALVWPIYKSTYERGDGLNSDNQDASRNYRDHVLMWAQDFSRTLDYLETRPDLDKSRVALVGWSWGGALGPLIAALEPRVRAVVLVSGGLEFQKTLPEVDPLNFAPRTRQPTLMINGRYDFFFPVETSQLPLFGLIGAPAQDKRQIIAEGGHAPPQDLVVRETIDWLDRYLGPVAGPVR